jgi:hypothetical protein
VSGNLVLTNGDTATVKPQHYGFVSNRWGGKRFSQGGFIVSRHLHI